MATTPAALPTDTIQYPALVQAAENASNSGQRWYVSLIRADVALIIAGALAGALSSFGSTAWRQTTAVISAVTLGTGATMRWVNRSRRPNRTWFDGRAVAESIKGNSWRYMMRTEPFTGPDAQADARFIADLDDILEARSDLSIGGVQPGTGQITQSMRHVRTEPFDARRATYISNRLSDQIAWYSDRATYHQRRAGLYFAGGLLAELLALTWAIFRIAAPSPLNLIGVLTSIAAAATALSQLHSHDELGRRYGFAAHELDSILTLAETSDEKTFPGRVREAESAISREHTMWIAKRS
ncbi:MAG TPA: DUF4231 domain-containing protein [Candidatus Sulfotelmatobacter sp.]|nr:DUF4231 domain-containing protein [Candidatus Sulfotelmatobacter sp.]